MVESFKGRFGASTSRTCSAVERPRVHTTHDLVLELAQGLPRRLGSVTHCSVTRCSSRCGRASRTVRLAASSPGDRAYRTKYRSTLDPATPVSAGTNAGAARCGEARHGWRARRGTRSFRPPTPAMHAVLAPP